MRRPKLHMNPLKLRTVHVMSKDGTTEEIRKPMSWEDAAKVSLILMIANVFIVFLPRYGWKVISTDPAAFLFELLTFAGQSFIASFIALTGLSAYILKRGV